MAAHLEGVEGDDNVMSSSPSDDHVDPALGEVTILELRPVMQALEEAQWWDDASSEPSDPYATSRPAPTAKASPAPSRQGLRTAGLSFGAALLAMLITAWVFSLTEPAEASELLVEPPPLASQIELAGVAPVAAPAPVAARPSAPSAPRHVAPLDPEKARAQRAKKWEAEKWPDPVIPAAAAPAPAPVETAEAPVEPSEPKPALEELKSPSFD
jgi:hypothetical protein